MQVVYFPREDHEPAPADLGSLYNEATSSWVTINDVAAAIRRRENVSVRPATASELKRAEALSALFQIGLMLQQKIGTLLDGTNSNVLSHGHPA
jgi:hypothetical protein